MGPLCFCCAVGVVKIVENKTKEMEEVESLEILTVLASFIFEQLISDP